jgi:hypothetical protein
MPQMNFKVGEMLNKRTPNSKTWINFDGSYTVEIHQGDVHYQDEAGNLQNINTDLIDEGEIDTFDLPPAIEGGIRFKEIKEKVKELKRKGLLKREDFNFQGLQVPFDCHLPRNFKRGYTVGKGQNKLKFKPIGASVSRGHVEPNEKNKVIYQDAWNDSDVILEVQPNGVKETIILKTDRAPSSFSFEVDGPLDDDLTAGTMKLTPAWLIDAAGTKRDVSQTIRREGEQTFIYLVADVTGLVYPIEIDPTVTIQPDTPAGKDTSIYSDSSNSNFDLNTALYISQSALRRALIQFDLSSIPTGVQVTLAELELYSMSFSGGSGNSLAINEVTSSWVENTVTWNTQPSFNATAISTTLFGPANSWRKLTITSSVDKMIKGILANNGWVLKCNDETGNPMWEQYYSSDYTTDTTKRPKLTVTYNQPPTAPVVTAPNGGETWNSLHTVEWQGAVDNHEIGIATGAATNPVYWENPAQKITIDKSGSLKEVHFKVKGNGSTTSSANRIEILGQTADGKPDFSNVIRTVNVSEGADTNEHWLKGVFSTPLQVNQGETYWIYLFMNVGIYHYYSASDVYSGGNGYWDGVHKVNDVGSVVIIDTSQLQYQIQLSTDNGSTWKDIVALTTAGATSYAYDFINEAESSTCLIRIRAYDGSAYGPWDQSNGVFTIVHNQAPTAPTGLSPSGVPKDRAAVNRFSWLHNDPNSGDPQSKFDLQWRLQGASTWNTVTQVTTNNYYDMPAGTLPKGTIEWQVRTYDQAGLSSPYSALTVFTAGDKPATPIFVTPADGATVSVSRPTVQWSSDGQTGYEVKVLDATGATTLWTTGQVTSTNKAVTVGIDLENNTGYDIQVLIKNADGLWSTAALSNIMVSYTPPAIPIISIVTSDTVGTITVNIENPIPQETEPSVSYNDLYRKESESTVWERISTNLGNNGSYTDYATSSGQSYDYKVITYGVNETFRESLPISNFVTLRSIYLHVVSDAKNTSKRFLMGEQKASSMWNLNHTFHKFAGRKNLVIDTEDSTDYGVDFTLKLRNTEERKALESIIYSQDVVCYRDSRGRKVFGVFVTFPLEDEFWGENTNLSLSKIDYREEI